MADRIQAAVLVGAAATAAALCGCRTASDLQFGGVAAGIGDDICAVRLTLDVHVHRRDGSPVPLRPNTQAVPKDGNLLGV